MRKGIASHFDWRDVVVSTVDLGDDDPTWDNPNPSPTFLRHYVNAVEHNVHK